MVRRFGIYSRNSNIKKTHEFSFLKLHGLKKFLRLMELIFLYAVSVIQLLTSLKFFIAPMALSFLKVHLHELKTSYFLKPYLTHIVFWHFLKSFISTFNISDFSFSFIILILIFTSFFYTFLNYKNSSRSTSFILMGYLNIPFRVSLSSKPFISPNT